MAILEWSVAEYIVFFLDICLLGLIIAHLSEAYKSMIREHDLDLFRRRMLHLVYIVAAMSLISGIILSPGTMSLINELMRHFEVTGWWMADPVLY